MSTKNTTLSFNLFNYAYTGYKRYLFLGVAFAVFSLVATLLSFGWSFLMYGAYFVLQKIVSLLFAVTNGMFDEFLGWMLLALAIGVPVASNPINSLFCLIGVFLHAIVFLITIKVEFLSMVFFIVYLGAIAILFLFVIMLLNLQESYKSVPCVWTDILEYSLLAIFAYIYMINAFVNNGLDIWQIQAVNKIIAFEYFVNYGLNDVLLFTYWLYTEHLILLLLSSMVLLSAMIGSIVLALTTE